MVRLSICKTLLILFTVLILVQGAAALTFEQAPLNPAFVAYTEGLDADGTGQCSIRCSDDSSPEYSHETPFICGLIPAPAVNFWPDHNAITAQRSRGLLPPQFDLRDEGRVTPVRDQGECGVGWAFATYGSLESTYLTDTETVEDFSENNMKNLCSNEYPDGFDIAPCDGGNAFMSTAYLTRGSGPILETDDPYALPMPLNISPTDLRPVLDIRDVTYLPARTGPLDNDLLKQTLINDGAIYVSFNVNMSCFADNRTTYYCPGGEGYIIDGSYASTLVGWDDEFPKENFNVTPQGDGAFIFKSSWGTGYGKEGYFSISYYDGSLGMDELAVFTGSSADKDRHIYQYDPLGLTASIGTGDNGTGSTTTYHGANVFTADTYERLTDVSFYTLEPGAEYTVSIFANFTTPPCDDTPIAWISGTCALPGYHTITLPETVILKPGDVFSVVLKVTNPTSYYPIAIEMPFDNYSSRATANEGESYVSDDGDEWEDLTQISPNINVCIKAFTHPLTVVPDNYTIIQAAIDAAADGDTIIVKAGRYPEEVVLEKPVTLLGVGMPVVATPMDGTGVDIYADNCTISGFSIEGTGVGENLAVGISGSNCTLSATEITGCTFGLYVRNNVSGLSLSNITMHDNEYNFFYWSFCENPGNTIDETVTVDGRPVIYREGVSGETIDASSNAGAVVCVNATDMIIRDTTTEAMGDGIVLLFCRDVCVKNVTTERIFHDGVWTHSSENITVRDSSFGPEMYQGIYAEETNGLQVAGNNFAYGYGFAGVSLKKVNDSLIKNNIMSGGKDCVGVVGNETSGLILTGNTIKGETGYGIDIINADMITVSDNTMNVTTYGIRIQNGKIATVSGNAIQCNDTGTGMQISVDGAEITGNTIINCSEQARMILNNSVVRRNSFSGSVYPNISLLNPNGDVHVYRNDFVLTPGDAKAGMTTTGIAGIDRQSLVMAGAPNQRGHTELSWHDLLPDLLPDEKYHADTFSIMAEISEMGTPSPDEVQDTGIWHSPTEQTYWYNGQAFTAFMGNYWSTYRGTDATHDGIGDTPFTMYANETDTCPLMKPFAWYLDKNPNKPYSGGGSDPSASMATSSALSAGGAATLTFTGSAVQAVTITTADGTGRILLTVDQTRSGPDGLEGPVYQYITAELSGMTADQISEAEFAFRVPAAWLRMEGIGPSNVALWRFHDGVWQELPTSFISEEGGWVSFTATTPGFSIFAIATGDGQKMVVPTEPTAPVGYAGTEGTEGTETAEENVSVVSEPSITVAIPGERATASPTEEATTPQESPIGFISLIGGAAGAALLFRRR